MVGITVCRNPDGIKIYSPQLAGEEPLFLDAREAAHLAETVKEARRRYWKRFKLEHMVEQHLKIE